MEIKKFNNINEGWKNYSFTESEFKELDKKRNEIKEIDDKKIFPLLLEYLKLNPNSINDPDIILEDDDDLIQVKDWEIFNNQIFITVIDYSNDEIGLEILSKYTSDFFKFLEDPESYRNAKKYNL